MNRCECDVLNVLAGGRFSTQRDLAVSCGHSLGSVNRALRLLTDEGLIDGAFHPTELAQAEFARSAPKTAIILAAGFGMRMIPINLETPKALLEVRGEVLIERIIRQLHEVGIADIKIVVGFMKESFEYLIDDFGVELIVNSNYYKKNNLHSLALALDSLDNAYIIPSDLWCAENPFRRRELYSWYMASELTADNSKLRVGRSLNFKPSASGGNRMVGICYLTGKEAAYVRCRVRELCADTTNDALFWESALYRNGDFIVFARLVPPDMVFELNTYEQLRELDSDSPHLQSDTLSYVAKKLRVSTDELTEVAVLKKGMTNRSFLFSCRGERYIMRVPGEGTEKLINRRQEAQVYAALTGCDIGDEVVSIDPVTGYKLTRYIPNARVCNPTATEDTEKCMSLLRRFHEKGLHVNHEFDIFEKIEFYEDLRGDRPSVYKDYSLTKAHVLSLRPYIEAHAAPKVLTHIDAVPDNFLFYTDEGEEKLRLIDWEYAGMQDPHVDIAMFCIYSLYKREEVDRLISQYFSEGCKKETRIKIYCYISACGLLWSNWCEYKSSLGVEFAEYSLMQYRYAKEYYRIAISEMEKSGGSENA